MLSLEEMVYEYEQVITGKKKYLTNDIFQDKDVSNEKTALMLFRYVFKNMLGWSPEDAYNYISKDLLVKMKLDMLLKFIYFPPEFHKDYDLFYLVAKCYPGRFKFNFKERTLVMYKRLVEKGKQDKVIIAKFPKGFFEGKDGERRSAICLRYAINVYGQCSSMEELFDFFIGPDINSFLKKCKLQQPAQILFEYPIDYLYNSCTTSERKQCEFIYYRNRFDYFRKLQEKEREKNEKAKQT